MHRVLRRKTRCARTKRNFGPCARAWPRWSTTSRDQLQTELTALTAKRDELQHRLLSRDLRSSEQERDLGARQAGDWHAAPRPRCDDEQSRSIADRTGRADDQAAGAGTGDELSEQYTRELGERDRQIAELTEQMASRAQQHFLVAAERDDLQARLERARADLKNAAQKRERKTGDQADAEREQARRDAALARSLEDLTEPAAPSTPRS